MRTVLAVDVGGTKVAAGLVDDTGRLGAHTTRPTNGGGAVFDAIADAIAEVADGAELAGAGIASAGPLDAVAGTVSPINIPAWQGFPLRDRVRELVDRPVRLAGDGVCMALGEHWAGAGAGSDAMLGMVVSTGVGGGLVVDGRPLGGHSGNAGHVGHVIVEPGGAPCACGGHGCVETVASGPNLVRWARTQGWAGTDAGQLADDARAGEPVPLSAFRRAGWAVGLAVVAAGAVCDIEVAVIGGGVGQAGDLLLDPVRETVAEYGRLSYLRTLRVVPARLGTAAGLYGAAALAFHNP
jgi:glucokinase